MNPLSICNLAPDGMLSAREPSKDFDLISIG